MMNSMLEIVSPDGNKETKKNYKAKNDKIVTYEYQASGIDVAITRILNGKPTRTLLCFLSKSDENGLPVIELVEVKGEKKTHLEYSEERLRLLLDGVKDHDIAISGCTSIPYLPSDKTNFVRCISLIKKSRPLADLFRQGIINMKILMEMYLFSTNWVRDRIEMPWYCKNSSYREDADSFVNGLKPENVHPKMIKYMVGYNMKVHNMTYSEALMKLYRAEGYSSDREEMRGNRKVANRVTMRFFVTLANRYDEPFALKCLEEYLDNDMLYGLNDNELDALLRIKKDAVYDRYSYSSCVNGSFTYMSVKDEDLDRTVKFDKNTLWEYILHAIAVGKGRSLSSYINLWKDYCTMTLEITGKLKDKYPETIQVAHDLVNEKYQMNKDEILKRQLSKSTELASRICDIDRTVGDIKYQFRILKTPVEFSDEATQQSNCVASYMQRCAKGETIVGSLRPKGSDTTLLTIEVDAKQNYKMIQIRGRFNRSATDAEQEVVDNFQTEIYKRYDKYLKGELDKEITVEATAVTEE